VPSCLRAWLPAGRKAEGRRELRLLKATLARSELERQLSQPLFGSSIRCGHVLHALPASVSAAFQLATWESTRCISFSFALSSCTSPTAHPSSTLLSACPLLSACSFLPSCRELQSKFVGKVQEFMGALADAHRTAHVERSDTREELESLLNLMSRLDFNG
jgi:hypothetical protein